MSKDDFEKMGFSISKSNEVQKTIALDYRLIDARYPITLEDIEKIEELDYE